MRFQEIGIVRTNHLLKAVSTHDAYTTELVCSAIERTETEETSEMLEAWEYILKQKRAQEDHEVAEYVRPTGKMDTLSIFGGPTHAFELVCSANGVKAMPNFETLCTCAWSETRASADKTQGLYIPRDMVPHTY